MSYPNFLHIRGWRDVAVRATSTKVLWFSCPISSISPARVCLVSISVQRCGPLLPKLPWIQGCEARREISASSVLTIMLQKSWVCTLQLSHQFYSLGALSFRNEQDRYPYSQCNYHCLHVQLHVPKLIANTVILSGSPFSSFMIRGFKKGSFSADDQSSQSLHRASPAPSTRI